MKISINQNFLHSHRLVKRLITKSNLTSTDTVLEIGAGKGIITEHLGEVCNQVIAVEIDKKLVPYLLSKFKGVEHIKIVQGDILKLNVAPRFNYKIFSNLPFNITSDIVTKYLFDPYLTDAFFIMQYEAFLKFAGQPYYENSYKSLLFKPYFETKLIYKFNPKDFSPEPRARIVLGQFSRKSNPDINIKLYKEYMDFLSFIYEINEKTMIKKLSKLFTYNQMKHLYGKLLCKKDTPISQVDYSDWILAFDTFLKYASTDKRKLIVGKYNQMQLSQNKIIKIHRNRNVW